MTHQLLIEEVFSLYGLSFSPEILSQFDRFLTLFIEYNAHTNLSSIRQERDIVIKHFADSLQVQKFVPLTGSVLDIGTGGGFPGIPLAITNKDLHIVLLDSVGKKVRACQHFTQELALENVEAFQSRAEEFIHLFEERVLFDSIVSRATAEMMTMLDYARPLLKLGGLLILYKTPDSGEWTRGLRRAKQLGFTLEGDHSYTLDHNLGVDEQHIRHIIVFKKQRD